MSRLIWQTVHGLLRTPRFTGAAVLVLAMGIAVNAAVFSAISATLFSDLPISDPDEVIVVWSTHQASGQDRAPSSLTDFLAWRQEVRSFEDLAAFSPATYTATGIGEPRQVVALQATPNLFSLWGLRPARGRALLPRDGEAGAPPVVVLSDGFWQRALGGDEDLLNREILLDGTAHTIVGILGPEMASGDMTSVDLWVPLSTTPVGTAQEVRNLVIVTGRLREGRKLETAQREVDAVAARLAAERPATHRGWGARVDYLVDSLINRNARTLLLLLTSMVGLVLLIACISVTNMILARDALRRRDTAVRIALGARRSQLLWQGLLEATALALAGTALGLALAQGLLVTLGTVAGSQNPFFGQLEIDGSVLAFCLVLTVLTPLAVSLPASLHTARVNPQQALREMATGPSRGIRTRALLVSVQCALAIALLVPCGLILRTVVNYRTLDLGFDPAGILTLRVDRTGEPSSETRFLESLIDQVRALPGVRRAALVNHRPLLPGAPSRPLETEVSDPRGEDFSLALSYVVGTDYFETLGLPLLRGRSFTSNDRADSRPVAVVSRETARRLWPDEDALGQRLRMVSGSAEEPWREVVGIVPEMPRLGREENALLQVYAPLAQAPESRMALVVRTAGEPLDAADDVRRVLWSLDPEQPAGDVRSLEQIRRDGLASYYVASLLFGVFSLFALLMATLGVHTLMTYSVAQRQRELGIRSALGGSSRAITWVMLRKTTGFALVGFAVGISLAIVAGRLLGNLIYGIHALDPLTFAVVVGVMSFVVLLASYLPVHRALRREPARVLQNSPHQAGARP